MNLDFLFDPVELRDVGYDFERTGAEHPDTRALIAYWETKRREDALPPIRAIEPRDLVSLLPHLFIFEPAEAGDWRIRLFGTALCSRFGRDLTGQTMRQIFDEPGAVEAIDMQERAVESGAPVTRTGRYVGIRSGSQRMEGVSLPVLGRDDHTVWIFGGAFPVLSR